jgi:hypothetical protein
MPKFLTLTLAAAALAAGGVAYAQAGVATDQPQPRAGSALGQRDPPQREARQRAMFERLDADHNGSISYAEFSALRDRVGARLEERRGQRFEGFGARRERGPMPRSERGPGLNAAIDGNRDGTVSREEFAAAAMQRFDRLDANHDGKVTPDERRGAVRERGLRNQAR